jgi:hypothetical protein
VRNLRRRPKSGLRPLLLLLCAAALPHASAAEPYPTDDCVSRKLRAAALGCQAAVGAWARFGDPEHAAQRQRALDRVAERLARRWQKAEAKAESAGVDCSETTIGAGPLAESLGSAGAQITLAAGAPGCGPALARAAGRACADLLRAEARHLLRRGRERSRQRLELSRDRVLEILAEREAQCSDAGQGARGLEIPTLAETVAGITEAAVRAHTASPAVPTDWTMITPSAEVEYDGRTLRPMCWDGAPYVFFAKRGTVNRLLVYYQGGGACWDAVTCGGVPQLGVPPTFKQTAGPGDDPTNFSSGFADLSNPENPFRDWHAVFVPYCTGDVHWGDAEVLHEWAQGTVLVQHKGYVNARTVEKWAREHFVDPEFVFVTGSSAGSYGAIVNSLPLQEFAYPSATFAVLGDAGNGVITPDFLENDLAKWGIEANLPSWIPALDRPLTELDAADLWIASAQQYPTNRFATYTSAYDGGTGGQTGFFNIMRNRDNVLAWPLWWNASCDWNTEMRALNAKAVAEAPNYRFYVGAGSRHTVWGHDKVYADLSGGVSQTVLEWVRAMIDGSPAWTDVECSDCGLLLPGDPRPSPAQPPFTAEERIVCGEPPAP